MTPRRALAEAMTCGAVECVLLVIFAAALSIGILTVGLPMVIFATALEAVQHRWRPRT